MKDNIWKSNVKIQQKNNMNYEWDSFIDTSINGTIFHRRSFLSYHIDRKFEDASFIFKKRGHQKPRQLQTDLSVKLYV